MAVTRINNNQITDASAGNVYVGVNATSKIQNYTITSQKLANSLVYDSDFTISGNLTVNGTTTTVDTVNTLIQDPLITLADGQTSGSPTVDIGTIGLRGSQNSAVLAWKESQLEFVTALSNTTISNTTFNISSYANLHTGNFIVQGTTSLVGNLIGAVNATSNITGGNLLTPGLISSTGAITSDANITGANLLTGGLISATGTATAGNLATGGTVSATGNITGGNVLTSGSGGAISGSGNITGGNILTGGQVSAAGNITAGSGSYFIGDGSQLTGVAASSVNANALVGNTLSANVIYSSLTTVGSLTSLSVVGTTQTGNLETAGLISATGTITGGNVLTGGNVSATGEVTGGNVFTGGLISATGSLTAGSLETSGTANVTGTITGGNITSNGFLSAVGTATVGNLATAGTMSATGNATAGNVLTGGIVSATSTVTGGNLATGGTISGSGNITGSNVLTGGLVSATGTVIGGNIETNGTVSATGTATVGNLATAGTVSATSTITGGNLATGGTVSATGTITGGNVATGGNVSATGNVTGGNVITDNIFSSNAAATTLTVTAGSISLNPVGNINVNSRYINNVPLPEQAGDAASKQYVDDIASGLNVHDSTSAATTGTLAIITGGTTTYYNGPTDNGQGATITTTGSYTNIDGVAINTANTRILVRAEANAVWNGIYVYSNTTAITRAADYNTVPEVEAGDFVFNLYGNVYGNTGWVQTSNVSNVGQAGNSIVFTQFSGAGAYTAGNALTLNGTQFNVNVDLSGDNTIGINGSNELYIPANATLTTPNIGAATGTSVSVTGTATAGNLATGGTVSATGTATAGNLATGGTVSATGTATVGNVATGGTVSASGTVTGGNIATGGTVSSTGTVTGGNIETGGTISATGTATVGNVVTGGTVSSTGTVTGGNIATAGTVSATGTATAGNVVTGGTVSATGNVTGANLVTGGLITSTGNVTGGNILTGGLVSSSGTVTGGNIETGGTISGTGTITGGNLATGGTVSATGTATAGNLATGGTVSATGNATAGNLLTGGNVSATGNVYASNFIGNISGNLTAPGANTQVIFNQAGIAGATAGFTFDYTANAVTVTGTITGGNLATGGTVSATSTITGGNIATGGTVSATSTITGGNIATGGTISATGNATAGNVLTGGLISATSNITGGNVQGGNIVLAGNHINQANDNSVIRINGAGANTNFAVSGIGGISSNVFYVNATTETASFGTDAQTVNAIVAFNATNSILMPTGNIGTRPAVGVTGMIRFNTTNNNLEVYDNSQWSAVGVPSFTVIDNEQFYGDGSTVAYTLGSTQTTNSCIVSINGVVQIPVTAYSVSGTFPTCVLTFTEAPDAADVIDVREITTTTTVTSISNSSGNAVVAASPTAAQINVTGDLSVAGSILGGNINSTAITSGTSNMSIVSSGGNIRGNVAGTTVMTISPGLVDIVGNLTVSGNATLSGNILGDRIQNGTTSIDIQTPNGDANITVGSTSNVAVFGPTIVTLAANMVPSANITYDLGTTTNRWKDLWLSNSTIYLGNSQISANATSLIFTNPQGGQTVLAGASGGNLTVGNLINANANGVGNIGSSTGYFNTVFAKATSAQYADLAEKYTADADYAPGTVVVFGGTHEVTVNAIDADRKVAGVISTNPSYIMNGGLEAEHVATVALTGRVPCLVVGPVRKGDLMVAAGLGRARSEADPCVGTVIGKALEDFDGAEGTIEVVVGRF